MIGASSPGTYPLDCGYALTEPLAIHPSGIRAGQDPQDPRVILDEKMRLSAAARGV